MEPASIRYKNPGAMWGNALARKWGANPKAVNLNDGKGQGNNIAVFPDYVSGISAQMDLWRSSPNYKNKRFADAIAIWSGHNSVEQYIAFVMSHAPGMTRDTVMNDTFWRGPLAIPFLKAQAWHEAGRQYPAPDADWIEARKRVLAGTPIKGKVIAIGSTATATAEITHQAVNASLPWYSITAIIVIGLIIVAGVIYKLVQSKKVSA